jgi:hypothetical protein
MHPALSSPRLAGFQDVYIHPHSIPPVYDVTAMIHIGNPSLKDLRHTQREVKLRFSSLSPVWRTIVIQINLIHQSSHVFT